VSSRGVAGTLSPGKAGGAFERIRGIMYRISGVNLTDSKEELIRSRIGKRVRAMGCESFAQYVDFVESEEGREELGRMVDALTTNKTSFFREEPHFVFLREIALPALLARGERIRFWSAGCSSGEEPYSLAILLLEAVPNIGLRDVRILATDISRNMLGRAQEGVYGKGQVKEIPPGLRSRHFDPIQAGSREEPRFKVRREVMDLVAFSHLNLMRPWPMKGPFDVILCRNVMIYLDRPTREHLVRRFTDLLPSGGYLMVGHSESLNGIGHGLRYVQPAVYGKP
jgi:chemotaxis protein methyltransferase CheR